MFNSRNDAFIMSQGKKVGNLKGRTAKAHAPVHKTAKPGPSDRKGHGPRHTQAQVLKAKMQKPMKTKYTAIGEGMSKKPYKDKGQSLGQVNSGFKVE